MRSPRKARRAIKAEAAPQALASKPAHCRAKTKEGRPCPAPRVFGGDFCYWHIPGNAVKEGSIGGRRRVIFDPDCLEPFAAPRDIADLLRLVMQTVVEVRAAKIDTKTATAIFYGCGVGQSILETADLDARLKALESRHDAAALARTRLH